ncbi:uncharacterized protein [Haliotis asinina]|uniref:uncharacterized protein n=1 Tax=Haliotis asinina TaxID=109174 RepID=UPI003531A335
MKSLARQGIGIDKRQAAVITVEQEGVLWKKGILGEDTPQNLIDTLVYLIGLNCALRAGDEHRNLRVGPNSQFYLTNMENGCKTLRYTEDVSKTNRGGLKHRRMEKKSISISVNRERPERCLVRLYEKYMSLRPRDGKCSDFYLRPLRFVKDDTWYADCPFGKHPLRGTVGRICKLAGFAGFYSNHSLRATTATRLYDAGVDEQLIAERTGHKSVAIRSYKRTSSEMEARVDDIIQRKRRSVTAAATVTSTTSSPTFSVCAAPATIEPATEHATVGQDGTSPRDLQLVLKDGVTLSTKF